MKRRALISVSDKDGIVELGKELLALNYEIVSTGGTYNLLKENGLDVTPVDDVTGFPECLDGRVKTLHPKVHGGILYQRNNENHIKTIEHLEISPIDIVVVNLYPFMAVISNPDHTLEQAIENIDIGGPSMVRAAAKNYPFVSVVTDKNDYSELIRRLKDDSVDKDYNFMLAKKAFDHTASYDTVISQYLSQLDGGELFPPTMTLTFEKKQDLRYGENPHQLAGYYSMPLSNNQGIESAEFLHGKELSYNNINDAQGAVDLVKEFSVPACVAVKHATPCGVAVGASTLETYEKAYEADPVSIFGGIVAFNTKVDLPTAERLNEIFLEVIIAPDYDVKALEKLSTKKNLRILRLPSTALGTKHIAEPMFKSVGGGLLIQEIDSSRIEAETKTVVTNTSPSEAQMSDLEFGMTVVKYVKSNAVVLVKNGQTVGVGGGEVSRIAAIQHAIEQAGDKSVGTVMASDAFFPFPDVVEAAVAAGVTAIIQPGGSKNDQLSIDECNKQSIPMVFTGTRHFRH